jgi:hypothetical protein
MRLEQLFYDLGIREFWETLLPDFVLAFAFFTSMAFAVLGKRFGKERPAIGMSAALGFALSIGLVWWERANGFSVRDLGPVAIGFAVILLALVMYQAVRQVGGSWSGAAIALGASIVVARVLQLKMPIAPLIIQGVTTVALVVGILALVSYRHGHNAQRQYAEPAMAAIRHDMSDLYQSRRLSHRLRDGMHRLRRQTKQLPEHPEETNRVRIQLQRMMPAEGYLTEKMARLRAKAHGIRNGHIARLEETRQVFAKLPTSAKKKASAELAAGYSQTIGMDTRLERLDKAVAENERRIRELNGQAQTYAANHDYRKLNDVLKAAERLQRHNTHLIKIIERTESKLSAVAKKVAEEVKQVEKPNQG